MSSRKYVFAVAAICTAGPVWADLTAEDVWADWNAYITGFGYAITGEENRSGNALVINDVEIIGALSSTTDRAKVFIDSIVMTNNGDGTVDVSFPEVMPLEMAVTDPEGRETITNMDYRQSGLVMTASGTPTDLLYTYTAQAVSMLTTAMIVNGESLGPDSGIEVTLSNLVGQSEMKLEATRQYAQTVSAENLSYTINATDPAGAGQAKIAGQTQALRFTGGGDMPLGVVQANDMDSMLDAGFSLTGAFTYGATATQIETTSPQGPFSVSFTADNGTLNVAMDKSGLSYDATQSNLKADASTVALPLPLSFAVQNFGANLTMPLLKSDAFNDFALGFDLAGFTMSEVLWNIFDPGVQLPRDPATVALDLTGKARLLFDFLDPSAAVVSGDPNITPAEVENLDVNRLEVVALGAELTGKGAFTFDNTTGGGAPTPVGGMDFKLVGGNTLLDKLVALQIVPEQDAMGARMMMGLLAVPGTEPDTLNSKIEINKDWHVFANGQRIQ
jgi:hypothetical protein